jgi:tRNA(Ile)-lysidine synthase
MSFLRRETAFFLETTVPSINLLSDSAKLMVGVSGGPDSLALLHVLTQLVDPARLVAAHLNHGFRKTAVSEAEFVRRVAEDWGVCFESSVLDVPAIAAESGESLEEAGRKARYAFFKTIADQYETPFILVGHHADDQAETVLMNLLRGTGLRGLRGMLPVSPLVEDANYYVLRPFLTVGRQEIEVYCDAHKLTPVFDESNKDRTFFRNRIRQELLPLLEDYNAGIRTHLCQLADMTAADVAVLDELAAQTWSQLVLDANGSVIVIDRSAWVALPVALQRLILRRVVVEKHPFLQDITFQAIEQARLVAERNETGQRFHLPGGLTLIVDYDRLIISEDEKISFNDWPQLPGESERLSIPGLVVLENGWRIEASLVGGMEYTDILQAASEWTVFVKAAPNDSWVVRPRLPGERFQPLGMNGRSAKIKEVMINRKVGVNWREKWPIVANEDHLIWFVGHMLDDRMKISEETTSIVKLHCYKG